MTVASAPTTAAADSGERRGSTLGPSLPGTRESDHGRERPIDEEDF